MIPIPARMAAVRRGLVCCSFILLVTACSEKVADREELVRQGELYSSRISFGWQHLDVFQLRGECRLDDESLVARGRFVLWGSRNGNLLRGDFYGPDGRPVVSLRADTEGVMLYMPGEESAVFMPGGLSTSSATIPTPDLIHLIRTGFPLELEPWELAEGMDVSDGEVSWELSNGGGDTLTVRLEAGSLFPSSCTWPGGELRIHGSSPHDEYSAWPWSWSTSINGSSVELELTQVATDAVPWSGIWDMSVPVPVDTLDAKSWWEPCWEIPQH